MLIERLTLLSEHIIRKPPGPNRDPKRLSDHSAKFFLELKLFFTFKYIANDYNSKSRCG